MSNEIAKALETKPARSLQDLIRDSAKELGQALPEHMRPERLVRIALTCIRLNPELSKCTPESFLGALFTAAQIGLEPVGGRSYLLPFRNSRKVGDEWKSFLECNLIVGYRGLTELFYRHESSMSIDMQIVHANDEFKYQYGTESFLKHTPARKDRGEVIGYYAIAKIKGGGTVFYFLSKEDALAHGQKYSKTFNQKDGQFSKSSPWFKEFDAMGMKTCVINLAKKLPLSVEMQRAIQVDETSRDWKAGIGDALDMPVTTDWHEQEAEVIPPSKPEPKPEPKQEVKQETKPEAAIIERMTRKAMGDIVRAFVFILGRKFYTDDATMALALKGWMETRTPIVITPSDSETQDGAYKIVEARVA